MALLTTSTSILVPIRTQVIHRKSELAAHPRSLAWSAPRHSGCRSFFFRRQRSCSTSSLVVKEPELANQGVATQAVKKTFSTFEEMLEASDEPVLVDFYAVWCGPCQLMSGVLQEVSVLYKDRLRVVKIDTEKYPRLATVYGVQALPTLILFRNGRPIKRVEGALPATELVKVVEAALAAV